jgi:F0F1-type ATP synthase membrane subunit b/b'
MDEASRLLRESEARAAEAERKLAGLETALAALKEETRIEAEAEAQRATRRTEEEIAKIQAQAELDIASAGKAARQELRQFASRLAIDLAEKKIRAGLTPPAQEALVADFAARLGAANPCGAPRPEAM